MKTILTLTSIAIFSLTSISYANYQPDAGQTLQQINNSMKPNAEPTLPTQEELDEANNKRDKKEKEEAENQVKSDNDAVNKLHESKSLTKYQQQILKDRFGKKGKKTKLSKAEKRAEAKRKAEEKKAEAKHKAAEQNKITINSIAIEGNKIFSSEILISEVNRSFDFKGKKYNLEEMSRFSYIISNYYRKHGYSFTSAVIPAQSMHHGHLVIRVIEGKYGKIVQNNSLDEEEQTEINKYLTHLAKAEGENGVIKDADLERANLILKEIPGFETEARLAKGTEPETADLMIAAKRTKRIGGSVSFDNQGNRYTGAMKATTSLYANNVFRFGDQITGTFLRSQGDMWYGGVGYSMPVGYSGMRTSFNYSRTKYQLGKEYESLGAQGKAEAASAGITYPLKRSKNSNATLSATYNHKWFTDETTSTSTINKKRSNTLPIGVNFDKKDALLGGGVTYGNVTWTHGILDLGNTLQRNGSSSDNKTAKSDGNFDKFNFDVSRIQALPIKDLTFFARGFGQIASKNLDSSEKFGIGGPSAIRAYPVGEGYGDEGMVTQMELRYNVKEFTPYALFDWGHVKTSYNPWSNSTANQRTIAGSGLGVKFNHGNWNADTSIAWRTVGNQAKSDSKAKTPTIWFNVGYRF